MLPGDNRTFLEQIQNSIKTHIKENSTAQFLRANLEHKEVFDVYFVAFIRLYFESGSADLCETVVGHLVVFSSLSFVTHAALVRVFEKFFQLVDDISLEFPSVYDEIAMIVLRCEQEGILPRNYSSRIPMVVLKKVKKETLDRFPFYDQLVIFRKGLDDLLHSDRNREDHFWNLGEEGSVFELKLFLEESIGKEETFLFRHEVVRQMISKSMTRGNRDRELVSQILSDFTFDNYGFAIFTPEDVYIGFTRHLGYLEDTILDVPNAAFFTSKFLARSIVDEVLPPAYLHMAIRLRLAGKYGRDTLSKVLYWTSVRKNHITASCLSAKFESIWLGADPHSAMAQECRRITNDAVYSLLTGDTTLDDCVNHLADRSLSPDLATVSVRKVVEAMIDRAGSADQKEREVAFYLGVRLLERLKEMHEIDGGNVREAVRSLQKPERMREFQLDAGPNAAELLSELETILTEKELLIEELPLLF